MKKHPVTGEDVPDEVTEAVRGLRYNALRLAFVAVGGFARLYSSTVKPRLLGLQKMHVSSYAFLAGTVAAIAALLGARGKDITGQSIDVQ